MWHRHIASFHDWARVFACSLYTGRLTAEAVRFFWFVLVVVIVLVILVIVVIVFADVVIVVIFVVVSSIFVSLVSFLISGTERPID